MLGGDATADTDQKSTRTRQEHNKTLTPTAERQAPKGRRYPPARGLSIKSAAPGWRLWDSGPSSGPNWDVPSLTLPPAPRAPPPSSLWSIFFSPWSIFSLLFSVLFSVRFFPSAFSFFPVLGPQNGTQIDQKSIKIGLGGPSFFGPCFGIVSFRILSVFDHFWMARTLSLTGRRV